MSIPIEDIGGRPQFRHLSTIAGIAVDLRYASARNFVGRDLYSPFDCGWLHVDAAAALERAVAWLAHERRGFKPLVLDALRPQRVQEALWAALDGTGLQPYLADPARGSIHSFGMALDITLLDADGQELDMGTGFDDLSERSQPGHEAALLERGELTLAEVENRELLRRMMAHAGFVGIQSEWWHYDCGDRDQIRASYERVV
ncbi:MAG: M15 family metallopeptidase [Gammaproteobacteria bacterium]